MGEHDGWRFGVQACPLGLVTSSWVLALPELIAHGGFFRVSLVPSLPLWPHMLSGIMVTPVLGFYDSGSLPGLGADGLLAFWMFHM